MKKEAFLLRLSKPYTQEDLLKLLISLKKTIERDAIITKIKSTGNIQLTEEEINLLTFATSDTRNDSVSKTAVTTIVTESGKSSIKPNVFKRGDVLMHPVFRHPYVLLDFVNNQWICGLLTTEKDCSEILIQCNSRMFHTSYFTKTIFTSQEPIGKFMCIFDNASQVRSVYKKLKKIFN